MSAEAAARLAAEAAGLREELGQLRAAQAAAASLPSSTSLPSPAWRDVPSPALAAASAASSASSSSCSSFASASSGYARLQSPALQSPPALPALLPVLPPLLPALRTPPPLSALPAPRTPTRTGSAAQHATIQLDVSTRGGALQSPRDPRARCVAGQSVEGGATDSPLTLFAPPHVIADAPQQATPSAAGGGASGGGGGGFLRRWLSKLGR